MKVLKFPLIKITGCFVFGIIVAHNTKPPFLLILILLLLGISFLLLSYFFSLKSLNQKTSFGIIALCTSFLIGIFTLVCNNQTLNSFHYIHHLTETDKDHSSEIIIKEKLKNTINNDRYVAKIASLDGKKSYGNIILNIRKDSVLPTIEMGSHLKVMGSFYLNRKPNNPNQFDYGKYLENQQIYAQIYADASNIQISPIVDKTVSYYASKLRNKIIRNLEKNHF
ncbi:ComEC/Rec2 family competence protein, partial [Flavobacterium sp.]|uniref:ComEC/Rec2 family competence protein n=1 Tax=Flavobacterium sp. TaxID=239 RepID=UPI0037507BEA